MIVSHDAEFLDRVCTDIVHFTAEGRLEYYPGNFAAFKAGALHGDEAEAERLLEISGAPPAAASANVFTDRMVFPLPEKIPGLSQGKPVLTLRNVSFQYDGASGPAFRGASGELTLHSRVGVVGKNGSGKSTLMSVLAGELQPTRIGGDACAGEVWRHMNMRLAYLGQQHMAHLGECMACTPLEYVQLRFKYGYDLESQRRFDVPMTPDEEKKCEKLAKKFGKRGRGVEALLSRTMQGGEPHYEVKWKDLPLSEHNSLEPLSKLRQLGVEQMAIAMDDRLACTWGGKEERALSTREVVKHLELFGLSEHVTCHRKISMLSSGQKSRLVLGASLWLKPHFLCLDEPTNYLDAEAVEQLQVALKHYRGGVVVVTHSDKFIEEVCNELWQLADGRVTAERLGTAAPA
eukprot:NODE_7735_length_1554_cov_6.037842.p1 GENE.NODE_7735_length_1554_cov_6.037842~~NODE_7735_length_1554_cov_6.037842.p1  ORF type:complete len:423 (-),score=166.84 NODE_7735_length_1554_cov_6.037842:284-1495(-)